MNVLIIDDHALIREAIALIIKTIRPDAGVWLAENSDAGMSLAAEQKIDVAFLDLQMPNQPGFVALEKFKQQHELMSVVVVSAFEDTATILRALEMGAKAFIPKSTDSCKMRLAIEAVLDGKVYLPENVLTSDAFPVLQYAHMNVREPWSLTERQKEVLALLLLGLSNKLIARKLNIVESTVKIHVSAILRELKVASRTQALVAVARHGIKLPM